MPRTKKTETEALVPAEPKKRRTPAAAPKTTTAVNHKHTTKKPVSQAVDAPAAPTVPVKIAAQEEIAQLAYSYWVARGCHGGSQLEDWFHAEQQLKA